MSDTPEKGHQESRDRLSRKVATEASRKMKARRRPDRGIWFGLGLFGVIGWSVAIPTLLCIALGVWLDAHWPAGFSWTLTLLFVGIVLGCLSAWHWLSREREIIEREEEDQEDD